MEGVPGSSPGVRLRSTKREAGPWRVRRHQCAKPLLGHCKARTGSFLASRKSGSIGIGAAISPRMVYPSDVDSRPSSHIAGPRRPGAGDRSRARRCTAGRSRPSGLVAVARPRPGRSVRAGRCLSPHLALRGARACHHLGQAKAGGDAWSTDGSAPLLRRVAVPAARERLAGRAEDRRRYLPNRPASQTGRPRPLSTPSDRGRAQASPERSLVQAFFSADLPAPSSAIRPLSPRSQSSLPLHMSTNQAT